MTLPGKDEKGYLKIASRPGGFAITAFKQHAQELSALFKQYGITCRKEEGVQPGEDVLVFDAGADRAKVQQVLRGYEQAKGS
jgi:hypothetical protein